LKITFHGGVKEIGGNKILLEAGETKIFLDFGRSMGLTGKYYEEYIKVRSKCALLDLLKLGILPKVNGIYPNNMLDINELSKDDDVKVQEKLPWEDAKDYWKNDLIIPFCKENKIDGVFVSHAHFDHIQDVSFIDKDINIYSTEITKIIAKTICDVSQSSVENQFFEFNDNIKIIEKKDNNKTAFPGELDYNEEKKEKEVVCSKSGYTFTMDVNNFQRNYITKPEGTIGNIRYKLIPVGHSILGACSVLLTTSDKKKVLYTGDIRFHGDNEPSIDDYIENIGKEKIDVMICEGTRIDKTETLAEKDVYNDLLEQVGNTKGLILIDFGWKDTTRFDTIKKVAEKTGRTFIINPKLAYLLYELYLLDSIVFTDPTTFKNVKVYKKRQENLLYAKHDYEKFKAGYLCHWGKNSSKNNRNIVRICEKLGIGGSRLAEKQDLTNEERKAFDLATHHIKNGIPAYEIRKGYGNYILMFCFWDANELFDLSNSEGIIPNAKYIRASCEPFNDEMEIDEEKLMNWLNKFEIDYDYNTKRRKKQFTRSHVSGHASRPELIELISKIKPRVFIPIHCERPKVYKDIISKIDNNIDVIIPKLNKIYHF
jgi:ribonuclease J